MDTALWKPPKVLDHDGECQDQCPTGFFSYNDKGNCLKAEQCPSGYYGYEVEHKCIKKAACNEKGQKIYKKQCVKACEDYKDMPFEHLGECVAICPADFYGFQGKGPCLS